MCGDRATCPTVSRQLKRPTDDTRPRYFLTRPIDGQTRTRNSGCLTHFSCHPLSLPPPPSPIDNNNDGGGDFRFSPRRCKGRAATHKLCVCVCETTPPPPIAVRFLNSKARAHYFSTSPRFSGAPYLSLANSKRSCLKASLIYPRCVMIVICTPPWWLSLPFLINLSKPCIVHALFRAPTHPPPVLDNDDL